MMASPGKQHDDYFTAAISRHIWNSKYRHREAGGFRDADIEATWRRVARALAAVETVDRRGCEKRFYDILRDFRFLPGGRIQAGAGTGHRITLFNCFVMGTVADSMDGIFDGLKEGAITLQQGGGVGYDFSTLRPAGTPARSVGALASGPVSFMRIWDSMCATLLSTGARRGAMMATLRCDHPDIEAFIDAKRDAHALRHFNLSVLVSDAFMEALRDDTEWALVFPDRDFADAAGATVTRVWSGDTRPVRCRVVRTVRARELWDRIMRATYDCAEPGVLFIDRINQLNNLSYREHISATNPCGELPLPPYGACDLGSINLTRFVKHPFTPDAEFDFDAVEQVTRVAVRLLDNVIDASRFPLEAQAAQARGSRRIGLGVTGLADALILLGITYDSPAALAFAARVMRAICHAAYRASVELAGEKGSFPFFERDAFMAGPFIAALPEDIRAGIRNHGIRNSHLTAIAPTGTISLLANNVSSGIEPVFDFNYQRRVLELDGSYSEYSLRDYAHVLWSEMHPQAAALPAAFIDAYSLPPRAHIDMQAALQPYVDNAISKTVNIPQDYDFAAFREVYQYAYEKGLKGCTTFRPNPVTGEILSASGQGFDKGSHCCDLEREAD
jgi:ribonucleoside-diphosphate reductase alpha chain